MRTTTRNRSGPVIRGRTKVLTCPACGAPVTAEESRKGSGVYKATLGTCAGCRRFVSVSVMFEEDRDVE